VTSYFETGSRLVYKRIHTADKTGQNAQSPIYSGLLKTVGDCHELISHRRHEQDKTVLSCPRVQYELCITEQ